MNGLKFRAPNSFVEDLHPAHPSVACACRHDGILAELFPLSLCALSAQPLHKTSKDPSSRLEVQALGVGLSGPALDWRCSGAS